MSVYKKLNHILEAYLTDTDKLPEGWKRYNKYQKIGKFVCINCSKERHTTVISPKAEKYILSLNCSGIVTSGAEGKHSAITKYDHVLGNKLDLQPLKGTGSTNKDYAELIIVLLQNEKTVYINMESFKIDDIKEIKEYIYTKKPELKEIAETEASATPNKDKKKCDGKILTYVLTPYPRHLDVAFN